MTWVTAYGALAVGFMMVMYALEGRGRRFILGFAAGCALSSSYGFLAGTWPFGAVEAIWSVVALRRYLLSGRSAPMQGAGGDRELPASDRYCAAREDR